VTVRPLGFLQQQLIQQGSIQRFHAMPGVILLLSYLAVFVPALVALVWVMARLTD
jgi:hypothetical protein